MLTWAKSTITKQLKARFGETLDFDPVMDGWLAGTIAQFCDDHDCTVSQVITLSEPSERFEANFDDFTKHLSEKSGSAKLILDGDISRAFSPLDVNDPFFFARSISKTLHSVQPGEFLLATGYYDFAVRFDTLVSAIEPAGYLQNICARGFSSPNGDPSGATRMAIYSDPDTIFVNEAETLAHADEHRRIVRFLIAARRDQ